MTVGVYGLVGGIVKLDDAGLYLSRRAGDTALARSSAARAAASCMAAPWLMKGLSVAGTAAMFLVGGGILVHGVPALHHWIEALAEGGGGALRLGIPLLSNAAVGIVAGGLVLAVVKGAQRVTRPRTPRRRLM